VYAYKAQEMGERRGKTENPKKSLTFQNPRGHTRVSIHPQHNAASIPFDHEEE
jgi:hypothetical protein